MCNYSALWEEKLITNLWLASNQFLLCIHIVNWRKSLLWFWKMNLAFAQYYFEYTKMWNQWIWEKSACSIAAGNTTTSGCMGDIITGPKAIVLKLWKRLDLWIWSWWWPKLFGNIMFLSFVVFFADGQLLVVWPAMGNLPPISLPPALSHLSYLLARPTERAVLCQMDRNISPWMEL